MKIHRLTAENFKRLRAIEITPEGAVVELRGANAQGKSSVLDAIAAALCGADAHPGMPIRKGADRAEITVDLGDYKVTRRFSDRDGKITTAVVVEAPSGARFPSPQRLLDEVIGELAFDPLEFTRMRPLDQLNALRELVTIDVDIDALDGLNRRDFEARTEINRAAAQLRAQAAGIPVPDNVPAERVDIAAIAQEMERAAAQNSTIDARRERRERSAADAERWAQIAAECRVKAAELRIEAESLERRATENHDLAVRAREQLETAEPLPELIDLVDFRERIAIGTSVNNQIAARERRMDLAAQATAKVAEAEALTKAITDRATQKAAAIAAAKFPIDGLSLADGHVAFNGIPFDQASQAEKLRVSTAIAMAANPKLRVLCIRDGSLLDTASMKLLGEIVASNDYQLWLEVTDDSGEVGIIIEDGAIKPAAALIGDQYDVERLGKAEEQA